MKNTFHTFLHQAAAYLAQQLDEEKPVFIFTYDYLKQFPDGDSSVYVTIECRHSKFSG